MGEKQWFWATLTLSSITIVSVVFAVWELVENHFFRDANYLTLHYLYITRGVASSLVLAFWAVWFVLRQRRISEEDLRRSHELYRGLLDDFPGGVILYNKALRVAEWNASAECIYGYANADLRPEVRVWRTRSGNPVRVDVLSPSSIGTDVPPGRPMRPVAECCFWRGIRCILAEI